MFAPLMVICALGLNPVVNSWAGDRHLKKDSDHDDPSFSEETLHWFERNQPKLSNDYFDQAGFVRYEPLLPYLDEVNWSLMSLRQFKEFRKSRAVRIPAGTLVQRDPESGSWHWPVGSEIAKLIQVKVQDTSGIEVWQDVELRLGRKLHDDSETEDQRTNWAMATYVRDSSDDSWKVVMPPHLGFVVVRGITPSGKARNINYTLTAPAACMTCHEAASASNADLHRGNEYVYGANDELITGLTRIHLRQWNSSPLIHSLATEIGRSERGDWIDLAIKDKELVSHNRQLFAPLLGTREP